MKSSASPLGKYSAIAATLIVILVIVAAIFGHTIGEPDQLIDAMALIAFGLVTGTAGSLTLLNGTVGKVESTVTRVDSHEAELANLRVVAAEVLASKEQ